MSNENLPDTPNVKHIKGRLIEEYCYNRFRAHGYEVDSRFTTQGEDVKWINLKTGLPFIMMQSEDCIELRQDPEHEAASDRTFIEQIEAEGVFAQACVSLVASYEQSLEDMLPAFLKYLNDEQLRQCLRSRPCVDWSWLKQGYFSR